MADAKVQVKSAKYRLVGEAVSHSRTDISVRDLKVITDEPLERNGTNMGVTDGNDDGCSRWLYQ